MYLVNAKNVRNKIHNLLTKLSNIDVTKPKRTFNFIMFYLGYLEKKR